MYMLNAYDFETLLFKKKWYYLLPPVQLLSDSFTYVFDLISNGIIKGPTMKRTLVVDIHGKGVMSPHV